MGCLPEGEEGKHWRENGWGEETGGKIVTGKKTRCDERKWERKRIARSGKRENGMRRDRG